MKRLFTLLLIFALCFPCYASENKWHGTKPPPGSQIDWSHPLSKGLVGCWLMNEGGGKRAINLYDNVGSTMSNVLFRSGRFKFNNNSTITVSAGKNSYLDTINYTLILKFVPQSTAIEQILFEKFAALYPYSFRYTTDKTILILNWDSGGNLTTTTTFELNVPVTIAVTRKNNTTKGYKIYANGIFNKSGDSGNGANSLANGVDVVLGGRTVAYFTGEMYYALFYNRILTPSEIMSLYIDPYQFIKKPNWGLLKAAEAAGVFVPQTQVIWFN